jgi:CMP-N,N'-diacetyllegionaminic acid synthase
MIRGKPVTCVIPVRGGSKGIPGKNMRRLGGDTLLERALKYARAAGVIDRVLVTTDDPEMYAVAGRYGAAPPSLRPAHLADDAATTVDAVDHLVADAAIAPGYILLLQVTTPLRTRADLDGLAAAFEASGDAEAAASVCAYEGPHPEKLQTIEAGRLASYLGVEAGRDRQLMPRLYELNGAFYLIDRDLLVAGRNFLPPGTLAYLMPRERSANLDSMTDWLVLDAMLAQGHWAMESYD